MLSVLDFGVLSARKYAHKIPSSSKINHNEPLSYPNTITALFNESMPNMLRRSRGQ